MANVTDPMIRAIQGSDPQNLMEYITRQKIYDSRYWKEECFGLTAVGVLEKATKLKTLGGLPTKFLCLALKLLQLQPDSEDIIESFIQQEDFKYVRALGALYLRLTGRPDDIYNELEPLYRDYRKLRCRIFADWTLTHVDEFVHRLLTETTCVGITLPRLPARATLQEAGYIDEGPRPTALRDVLEEAGGPLEFLKLKVEQESPAAIELYNKRKGIKTGETKKESEGKSSSRSKGKEEDKESSRKHRRDDSSDEGRSQKKKKKKESSKKERNYGSLFKKSGKSKSSSEKETTEAVTKEKAPDENSEEYWNEQRAKLGLKALK